MEIACYYASKNIDKKDISKERLKLKTYNIDSLTNKDLSKIINDINFKILINKMCNKLFNNEIIFDVSEALSKAPYYSASKEIPEKMRELSQHVVKYIIGDMIIDDDFYILFDEYYTYYQLYSDQHTHHSIEKTFNDIIELMKTCEHFEKTNSTIIEKIEIDIKSKLKYLFSLNCYYATNLILDNYNKIKCSTVLNLIWQMIENLVKQNKEKILVILLLHLKAKLIQKSSNVNIRRKLYYEIDTDSYLHNLLLNKNNLSIINSYFEIVFNVAQQIGYDITIMKTDNFNNILKMSHQLLDIIYK
jgi:hypothetical protein